MPLSVSLKTLSCRRLTGINIVTTVPLSVCYRALTLSVRVNASNFVPYACDRVVTGGVRGSGSTTLSPESLTCNSHPWGGLNAGALCLLYVLSFYNRPGSLISMPLVSSQVPSLFPQEKKSARCCRFESLSDSGFIAPSMAFYRPYKARTDISFANKRVT